jgi:hypothetical protein
MAMNRKLHVGQPAPWRTKVLLPAISLSAVLLLAPAFSQDKSSKGSLQRSLKLGDQSQLFRDKNPNDPRTLWDKHLWLLEVHGDGKLIKNSGSSCHDSDLDRLTREFFLDKLAPPLAKTRQEDRKAWNRHLWLLEVHGDGQLIKKSCNSCHDSDLDRLTREFFLIKPN